MTRIITNSAELVGLVDALRGEDVVAFDSESDSLHHFREKVCLVQVGTRGGEAFALRDLSPLAPMMADPAVEKVFHGADYDVTTLKRDFAFRFESLFDTMLAARFLGRESVGLVPVVAFAEDFL